MVSIVLVECDSYAKLRPAEVDKSDLCTVYSQKDNLKIFLIWNSNSTSNIFLKNRPMQLYLNFYLYDTGMNQRKQRFLYSMHCYIQYSIHILERIYIIPSHNLLHILVQGLYHLIKLVNLVGFHGIGRSPSYYTLWGQLILIYSMWHTFSDI